MHGGTVEAHSEGPGRGSEFIVRLPLRRADAPLPGRRDTQARHGTAPLAGRRVLVVDDNRDAADSLCLLLHGAGAEVEVRYDGPSALQALAQMAAPPDVIILDIGMPGMDGYDTARAMRRIPGLEDMTLIALTGWGADSDRQKSSEAGFDRHLTKPVQLDVVQELLAQLAP
jgi:CheY-like chemotaxis protein